MVTRFFHQLIKIIEPILTFSILTQFQIQLNLSQVNIIICNDLYSQFDWLDN